MSEELIVDFNTDEDFNLNLTVDFGEEASVPTLSDLMSTVQVEDLQPELEDFSEDPADSSITFPIATSIRLIWNSLEAVFSDIRHLNKPINAHKDSSNFHFKDVSPLVINGADFIPIYVDIWRQIKNSENLPSLEDCRECILTGLRNASVAITPHIHILDEIIPVHYNEVLSAYKAEQSAMKQEVTVTPPILEKAYNLLEPVALLLKTVKKSATHLDSADLTERLFNLGLEPSPVLSSEDLLLYYIFSFLPLPSTQMEFADKLQPLVEFLMTVPSIQDDVFNVLQVWKYPNIKSFSTVYHKDNHYYLSEEHNSNPIDRLFYFIYTSRQMAMALPLPFVLDNILYFPDYTFQRNLTTQAIPKAGVSRALSLGLGPIYLSRLGMEVYTQSPMSSQLQLPGLQLLQSFNRSIEHLSWESKFFNYTPRISGISKYEKDGNILIVNPETNFTILRLLDGTIYKDVFLNPATMTVICNDGNTISFDNEVSDSIFDAISLFKHYFPEWEPALSGDYNSKLYQIATTLEHNYDDVLNNARYTILKYMTDSLGIYTIFSRLCSVEHQQYPADIPFPLKYDEVELAPRICEAVGTLAVSTPLKLHKLDANDSAYYNFLLSLPNIGPYLFELENALIIANYLRTHRDWTPNTHLADVLEAGLTSKKLINRLSKLFNIDVDEKTVKDYLEGNDYSLFKLFVAYLVFTQAPHLVIPFYEEVPTAINLPNQIKVDSYLTSFYITFSYADGLDFTGDIPLEERMTTFSLNPESFPLAKISPDLKVMSLVSAFGDEEV